VAESSSQRVLKTALEWLVDPMNSGYNSTAVEVVGNMAEQAAGRSVATDNRA